MRSEAARAESLRRGDAAARASRFSADTIVARATRPALAVDAEDTVVTLNRAAEEYLGCRADVMVGRNISEVLKPQDIFGNRVSSFSDTYLDALTTGEAVRPFDMDIQHATGRRCRVQVSVVTVLAPQAADHRFVFLFTPVLRRRRADEAIDRLLHRVGAGSGGSSERVDVEARTAPQPHLTRRQHQILCLIARGRSAHQVAKELNLSVHTVRNHVQSILRRLGAQSQLEAVAKATAIGMLTKRGGVGA